MGREKAIKGIEHCEFGGSGTCYEKECPYYQSNNCADELKNDILALLKEQETANLYKCKNCGTWVSAENVIRCKDCAKYDRNTGHCSNGITHGDAETWFCADGKRK